VAVVVTFCQVVLDGLYRLMGVEPRPLRPRFPVVSLSAMRKTPGRREYPRGRLIEEGGVLKVKLAGPQGSGVLSSVADANCFIVLAEDRDDVAVGDLVDVQPFDDIA